MTDKLYIVNKQLLYYKYYCMKENAHYCLYFYGLLPSFYSDQIILQ